jgi:transcriptional regulator with XRE-family HTH domain
MPSFQSVSTAEAALTFCQEEEGRDMQKKERTRTPNRLLREARLQRHWSQQEVADRLDTNTVNINRWEQGKAFPAPLYRRLLTQVFEATEEELGLLPPSPEVATVEPSPVARLFDPAIPLLEKDLVGREDTLVVLKQLLLQPASVGHIALYGLPGVGKTALALALVHDQDIAAHFHDGILWAGLGRAPDHFRLLSRWGGLLGLSSEEMAKAGNPDTLAEMLHGAIGTRRLLLILDDAWEISTALDFQIGGSQCAHLVTTRFPPIALHFAGEYVFPLQELNEQDSITLLQQLAPAVMADESHKVQELVHAVGGLPLALTLMGKYLQVQAHDRQPRRLHRALEQLHSIDTRLRLTMPQASVAHHPSLPAHTPLSLQAAIEISEQQLDPQVQEWFRTLSVFPPKPNSFSEEAALAVSQAPVEMLDQLSDVGLLESNGVGRYTLHQIIADYASTHLKDSRASERLITYYTAFVEAHTHDYELLEQEGNNIFAALHAAIQQRGEELIQLIRSFAPFLLARGLYEQVEELLQRAKGRSEAGEDLTAHVLLFLGKTAQRQGF